MTLLDKSQGSFLPFLIILILKQDLTVYTIHIKGARAQKIELISTYLKI